LLRNEYQQPESILCIHSDVTERRRLEEEQLRNQRLESIGSLASGIAHDLNNVLTPIMVAIDMLKSTEGNAKRHKTMEQIEQSAQRGSALVKQVLAFSHGTDGMQTRMNLKHVASEVGDFVADTFPCAINFHQSIAGGLWTVCADPTQMHQVMLNLCVNARDAMPHGGHLTLKLENSNLSETDASNHPGARPGAYVCLTVADSGTGIPEGIRRKIFEAFFSTKPMGQGTGLGLSTVNTIVRNHHGFLALASEVGKGSTFKVYIPALQQDKEVSSSNTPDSGREAVAGNGELILIVDDEKMIRFVVKAALEAHGYRALVAANGADGMAQYVKHKKDIALVIVDLAMPVLPGEEFIRLLRRINSDVCTILSSGMDGMDQIKNEVGKDLKVSRYLPKPYLLGELLHTVGEVLAEQPR
jgi:nitrogen-specific signal transduction histidine kinase/CheY-like chemotaxis protein